MGSNAASAYITYSKTPLLYHWLQWPHEHGVLEENWVKVFVVPLILMQPPFLAGYLVCRPPFIAIPLVVLICYKP
jgi:hypothetical protein